MFLQFFLWGSWYVAGPSYLTTIGFTAADFGWMYSVGPIAGMISPFIVGMIADRFFPTQRVLGVMHLLGAASMFGATMLMTPDSSPTLINLIFFAHMLFYFPTLALTNSLAMHNMQDSEKEFPLVRVFGTIGWIIAGYTLGWLEWGPTIHQFQMAAIAGLLLGLYSFTLPHTPPPAAGKKVSARELMGIDAFVLLKQRPYLVFMISSLLICIPLAFYYQMAERFVRQAGIAAPPSKMTWGQISEAVFLVMMPFFFKRLGVKWMLAVGMAAWVVRYGLFSAAAPSGMHAMILIGIILHGICYDFFFVTGQIYTDKTAPKEIRGQAQGMLVLFTLGLGMFIGAQVAGQIEGAYTPQESLDAKKAAQELGKEIEKKKENLESVEGEDAKAIEADIKELTEKRDAKSLKELTTKDWQSIWLIPAIGAGVILLLFIAIFHDTTADATVTQGEAEEANAATHEELP